jgi:hypothetical protein
MTKPRRKGWAVGRQEIHTVRKSELVRSVCMWKDNAKMAHKETGYEGMD